MPRNRFDNANAAQAGACNTLAVANALVEAIREARNENNGWNAADADPAVRLIAHQLAFLLNLRGFESDPLDYVRAMEVCEARAMAAAKVSA